MFGSNRIHGTVESTMSSMREKMVRYRKFKVEKCPQQQLTWDEAAERLNCSLDKHGHNTYHCVPEQDKSSLVEFCYDRLIGLFQKGKCIHLSNTGFLNSENCLGIFNGCPKQAYLSNQLFKYPDCQNINTDDGCFVADPTCPNKSSDISDISAQRTSQANSTIELSFNNGTTPITNTDNKLELGTGAIVGIGLGVFVFLLIVVMVIILCLKNRQEQRKRRRRSDNIKELNDFSLELETDLPRRPLVLETDLRRRPLRSISHICDISEALKNVPVLQNVSLFEFNVLVGLLCVDQCRFELDNSDHQNKLKEVIRKLNIFGKRTWDQQIKTACQGLQNKGLIHIDSHNIVSFVSEDVEERVFRTLYGRKLLNHPPDILNYWCIDVITKYVKTCNYHPQLTEKCICIHKKYNHELINRLQKDILTHPTILDNTIHREVSDILKIPQEILKWDFQSRERYENYLKLGSVPMYRARGMIVGCAGAGKTTFLRRLMKWVLEDIKKTQSTIGLEVHNNIFYVDETNFRLKVVNKDENKCLSEEIKTSPKAEVRPIQLKMQGKEIAAERKFLINSEDMHDVHVPIRIDDKESHLSAEEFRNVNISARTEETTPLLSGKEEHEVHVPMRVEEKDIKLLSILDFGGQSAYYACHQIYLSTRAFYCLLVDISKKLNDKINPKSCGQKGTVFQTWTYKDYFVFWLKSIHTYCAMRGKSSENSVRVILIATHCEGKSKEDIEKFFDELIGCLPEESDIKQYLTTEAYCTLSLDFEDGCDVQISEVERVMIETMQKQAHWGEKIPATWGEFERFIVAQREDKKMITLTELQNKNIGLPKDEREMNDLLRFFHGMGYILHFDDDNLRETIILDIQWFVDAFKNVITDINHVKDAAKQVKGFNRFVELGELDEYILLKLWEGYPGHPFTPYKDSILLYMQRLGLLATCTKQDGNIMLYVPSMNKKTMEEADMAIIRDAQSKTSVLKFKFEFLPYFVFYRLVVTCIGKFGFSNKDNVHFFYHNAAIFCYKDHHFAVAVVQDAIQIQVFRQKVEGDKRRDLKLNTNTVCEIRQQIENMLTDLTKAFRTNLQKIGYMCRNGNLLELIEDDSFIEESMLKESKEFICPNHNVGKPSHYLISMQFLKHWTKGNPSKMSCIRKNEF